MRPAFNPIKPQPVEFWDSLPNGEWLQQQVESGLADWWPKLFGYHLLKLGPLATTLTSSACPISHQVGLDLHHGSVRANVEQLPFKNSVIDVCVAPFCLEFQQDPHALLREVDRVMVCGGYLVLVGFNGASPLAAGYLMPHKRNRPPWSGRLFTPYRVEDWLGVLGYSVIERRPLTLHSFVTNPQRFSLVRQTVETTFQTWGSVYMIVARKMDCPMTPVKQKWRTPRPLILNPIADLAGYQGEPKRAVRDKTGLSVVSR